MLGSTSTSPWLAGRELTYVRFFLASPEEVFDAWTRRDLLSKWWGPADFELVTCQLDPRPGGSLRLALRAPDGTVRESRGTYLDLTRPWRLRFTEVLAEYPEQIFVTTVTFKELGAMTRMDVTQTAARSESLAGSTGFRLRVMPMRTARGAAARMAAAARECDSSR